MATDKIVYRITTDPEFAENGEELGIEMIAYTANPAIMVKGMAFRNQSKPVFFNDNLKYRIAAPALIPMEIYRNDEDGEYYVEFTEEEIENIYVKLMSDRPNQLFNLEHNSTDVVDAFILESWLVGENTKGDRSWTEFGIDVPKGTLMIVSQFNNKEQYTKLVEAGQTGYSIEGFLGMKLNKQEKQITMEEKLLLPDGEWTIDGKIYVIKDGAVVEVKEAEVTEEVAMEDVVETEETTEEVEMSEDVVEEEVTDEVVEEEMAEEVVTEEPTTDVVETPVIDEAAIMAIVQPKLDELYQIIGELKAGLETAETEKESVEEIAMNRHEMSFQHKFTALTNFLKK